MSTQEDDVDDILDAIEKHFADRLSDWEAQFVESLQRQRGDGRSLTVRQGEKLNEVFERVSNRGRG